PDGRWRTCRPRHWCNLPVKKVDYECVQYPALSLRPRSEARRRNLFVLCTPPPPILLLLASGSSGGVRAGVLTSQKERREEAQRMQVLYERGAGLDVHQKSVVVTVLVTAAPGQVAQVTRTFGTMTADLLALNSWLDEQQVKQIALESTGVYWYPV